ncbi:DUF459 domain-containing protein [Sinorhizobium sp. BG8]|uniref:SGNH/GDSL hydrolase family protein n=1 Tax=Sinorhizobium sp. BG8 TaxID=2613773 RepID=UPI00193CA334|nr:DUF459 domain-containing protein [Sinorhizobium sp. BG8]QRM56667.1 DUF459 domain-containing protein [Sinorhizobium sp. BG8]
MYPIGRVMRIVLLIVVGALAVPDLGMVAPASAQERPQRKNIFQLLFGGFQKREVVPQRQIQQRQRKAAVPRAKKAKPAVATKPAPVVIAKLPDAKVVLVVGDFTADGLGEGLVAAFEPTPGISVEARTSGSSGLVRDDYHNWPAELPVIIDELKPAVVVISLGANDRQQMAVAGIKEKFRSDVWTAEYEKRVSNLATIVRSRQIPLLWVGMPAFQSSSMTADMITLNNMYRAGSEKAGGEFIDIWDGFVDENGKFVTTGSDINGQQLRLRGSDGINFTKAGKRKLAFYVEKEIRRILIDSAASGADIQGTGDLKDLIVTAPLKNEEIIKTQPISLTDPELDGGAVLLGSSAPEKGTGKSPRELLVDRGEVQPAPAGRVDDFRLDKTKPSSDTAKNVDDLTKVLRQ